jgi:serine/threonine-protein kinase
MSDARGDDPTVAGPPTDTPAGGAVDVPMQGRIADRWDIQALLGTGGMGNVYKAIDVELGEVVALKVLRRAPGAGTLAALERFRHEVKLARRVTHVNVARTHDIGRHGDTLFLTMELIEGESLGARLGRGPVPWREAVLIARGICAGVGAAHAAGVVHRDLKPDNVMLARDGRVVVTDFGIAAVHNVARGTGDEVEVTGTPAWMAPEQLAGEADARSDVYAIGEIVWNMLTGAHPWRDSAAGTLQIMQRVTEPPPRLPRGSLPDTVVAVVERCLDREPSQRFHDAGELGAALEVAAAAGETGSTPPRARKVEARSRDILVGVEPIRNLGDPADEFVAAGLAEDLVDALGRVRGIRVRSLGDGGGRDDLDVVVAGSLRRAGDAVRITIRAAGARDGFQIWSQRFDRRLDEILKVTDEVARDVATALSQTAGRGGGRDAATDQFVVELYLKARHLAERGWLDDPRPLTLYQAALERDPDSPIVLSAYATLLARRLNATDGQAVLVAGEAEQLARRAIAHGPDMGESWAALAVVFYNQGANTRAVRAIRLALERGPALAEAADSAGRMLLELEGELDEAVMLLERARWANPRLPSNLVDLVRAYGLRGDWPRVEELFRDPGTESAPARLIARARMALWRGETSREVPSDIPGLIRFTWAAETVAEAMIENRFPAASQERWLARLGQLRPGTRIRRFFAQLGAEIALRVGDHAAAWILIDEAVAHGLLDVNWFDRMPLLAPLRADPRFAAARDLVAARGAPMLAAWRGPLPEPDIDAWPEQ